jgi:fructose-1,6-bisphosphatase/inositol monophosphatase family enzyme
MVDAVPADRRALVVAAVREAARRRIMPRFRTLDPSMIRTKSGPGDLVTLADTEAEADIAEAVRAGWPEAAVTGEESVAADPSGREVMGSAPLVVVVDPVDGTWNFAKGLSVFGTIVAVLRAGRPAWGMLHDPVMDDWIEAAPGEPAIWRTGKGEERVLQTSAETREGRMVGYVTLGLHPKAVRGEIAAQLPAFSRATSLRCACHEYRMVAQGNAEFCLSGPVPHPWDHAAGALAVERAGGVSRFLDGAPYEAGRLRGVLLTAASEAVWETVARRFSFLA